MHSLGATLKQLRHDRHLTQTELYGGVISRSFAGRLERGEHDITAEKLWTILDRLHVSPDEFRFIQQDYQPTTLSRLTGQLNNAYDHQNFPEIRHLEQRFRDSPDQDEQIIATIADLGIKAYDGISWPLTPAMDRLWQHYNRLNAWGLYEMRMATAWLTIAQVKHQPIWPGVQKMHASGDRYQTALTDPFHVGDLRMSFDLVALQILLLNQQVHPATILKDALQSPTDVVLSTDAVLQREVCLCLWNWYFGDPATADHLAQRLMALPSIQGYHNLVAILNAYQPRARKYRQSHTKHL